MKKILPRKSVWLSIAATTVLSVLVNTQAVSQYSDLSMYIYGNINEKCELDLNSETRYDFSDNIAHSIPISVNCNIPMGIHIKSEHGGLKLNSASQDVIEPYNIKLNVGTINNTSKSELFNNDNIVFRYDGIPFKQQGIMMVSLTKPLLIAGSYSDTLTIDILPFSFTDE